MLPPSMMVNDDREFMTELFLQYQRIMYSEITKIVSDYWEAEDIFQNSLIKLSAKVSLLRELDERRRISYVITTVRNQAKNYIRDKHNVTMLSLDDDSFNMHDSVNINSNVEQSVIFKERIKDLALIWNMLDETSRVLLEGKYILKKSNEDLGKMLGINPSSIRMMLTRARRKALELMKTEESD